MAPILATIIMSHTSSYSSTGGNTADDGAATQGSSESSANSENVANYSTSGTQVSGSATVHIQTTNNGVTQEETVTKQVPPGGSVDIEVSTTSSSGGIQVNSAARTEIRGDSSTHMQIVTQTEGGAQAAASPPPSAHPPSYRQMRMTAAAPSPIATSSASSTLATPAMQPSGFSSLFKSFWKRLFGFFGFGG